LKGFTVSEGRRAESNGNRLADCGFSKNRPVV
jgi:hypothetical protein